MVRQDLEIFIGAIAAAVAGVMVALGVAALLPITAPVNAETSAMVAHYVAALKPEPREQGFFMLAATGGAAAAAFAVWTGRLAVRVSAGSLLLLAALVPVVNFFCGRAQSRPDGVLWGAAGAAVAIAVLWFAARFLGAKVQEGGRGFEPVASGLERPWMPFGRHAVAVLLLAAVLLPDSWETVAGRIGYDTHPAIFMIGSALHRYGAGAVPGLDYSAPYGVGMPWLFSLFLGDSADQTIVHYAMFIVAAMYFFYLGAFYLLRWLLRSWTWALATTLVILLLQIHATRTFFDPSSYVLRYPLLIAAIACCAWWAGGSWRMRAALPLAGTLGAGLFLNTETGLFQVLAAIFVAFAASGSVVRGALRAAAITAAALAVFLGACVMAFGARALSSGFLYALVEPLILFGGGFNSLPVEWLHGWHLLYNIAGPGICLATIGWCAVYLWRQPEAGRARLCALAMTSSLAIMLSAKYGNFSIVAYWHVGAVACIIVLAWWLRQVVDLYGGAQLMPGRVPFALRTLLVPAIAGAALCLLRLSEDERNPDVYALNAYVYYPSLLNIALRVPQLQGCQRLACSSRRLDRADIELIRRHTDPRERVAVVGPGDWTYLVEAKRAPMFALLPSDMIFTKRDLENSVHGLDKIFVPRSGGDAFGISNPALAARLAPVIRDNFRRVEAGQNLELWSRNVRGSGAGQGG
jgi:hypothetical protein